MSILCCASMDDFLAENPSLGIIDNDDEFIGRDNICRHLILMFDRAYSVSVTDTLIEPLTDHLNRAT